MNERIENPNTQGRRIPNPSERLGTGGLDNSSVRADLQSDRIEYEHL